jgi:hypothetical protein
MTTEIEKNQDSILTFLNNVAIERGETGYISAKDISEETGLSPLKINQAVELLHSSGQVEWLQAMGSAPYSFLAVKITARGAYMFQRKQAAEKSAKVLAQKEGTAESSSLYELLSFLTRRKPPIPEGSPYGFTDQDWEAVSARKADKNVLCVVFGCKFDSKFCNYEELVKNVRVMFEEAVKRFNYENKGANISLRFEPLHAGYGEHLFNEIARDIISSDIAIFETSDMAPNIFIEIGVALTWGSRVFLIKNEKCPSPPSDISGQTYADYSDNGKKFVDPQHSEKLYRMVERAIKKKG